MEKKRTPVKFTSSAMRARFNPHDGQLYVAGLNGWQSDAAKLTGLDRIRYTGKPIHTVSRLKVARGELQLTFTRPLDPASVDPQNFSAERWNYHRTQAYGSAEYSVDHPEKKGHDPVEINAARLSPDGRTVLLRIDDLKPANQMLLKYQNLKGRDGTPIQQTILHTIHAIP